MQVKKEMTVLLQDKLGDGLKTNVRLAPYTTFGIGGAAKYFYEANSPRNLVYAYDQAFKNGIRSFILGGGSNILFADEGFDGLVIRDDCREYQVKGDKINVQAGALLNDIVDVAEENSLTGLEFAAGIPGNVGGAIYGNAGAFGGSIADVLESVVIYTPGPGVQIVEPEYFKFGYRHSKLKANFELILSATFKLRSGKKSAIADRINEHRNLRRAKHPDYKNDGCAGSIFKNIKQPELIPAGKLLDEAGVRGMKVGGAEVFHKHCNIIVNGGNATAKDVMNLSSMMRRKVIEKFNIELEYELMIVKP